MKVKDAIMFQVATNRNYKVGDVIVFGKEYNGQAKRILNFSSIYDGKRIANLGFDCLNNHKKCDNELLLKLSQTIEEYDFVLRELAVEFVRQKYFKNLPSRMSCLFLVDNKDLCIRNFDEFVKKDKSKKYQVVAVKLNGNVFYAKDIPINSRGISFEQHIVEAKKYWSQNQKSTDEVKEILFEGEAEIIEIIKQNY